MWSEISLSITGFDSFGRPLAQYLHLSAFGLDERVRLAELLVDVVRDLCVPLRCSDA